MPNTPRLTLPVRVAMIEIVAVHVETNGTESTCHLHLQGNLEPERTLCGKGKSPVDAIVDALQEICIKPFTIPHAVEQPLESQLSHCRAIAVELRLSECTTPMTSSEAAGASTRSSQAETTQVRELRAGAGQAVAEASSVAHTIAILRAVSNAGLLKREFRANNQKVLRDWAQLLVKELDAVQLPSDTHAWARLEREAIVLDAFNRVASAAVVTAVNHPEPASLMQLYDTSAWLFDPQGHRRRSYTSTNLWLAWYPGIENDSTSVDEVIRSMPAAPDIAIPWIVKLFENPTSRLRFRGAVDLEDHDVMHVLLGRGLQDQDEAFVLGFAMGTAKRLTSIETWAFKFVLTRLYPEPYRIPKYLHAAFDLGVACGQKTGTKNLYKQPLKQLRGLTIGEARARLEIDVNVLRDFYRREREQIPFTIASLRLP